LAEAIFSNKKKAQEKHTTIYIYKQVKSETLKKKPLDSVMTRGLFGLEDRFAPK
jgi:hypothetical protein